MYYNSVSLSTHLICICEKLKKKLLPFNKGFYIILVYELLIKLLFFRGSNLLAVNADGNMPYDICEDEAALDYIEGEMARRGVTQELIDETRAATELQMLKDLHQIATESKDLETYDHQGATPVSNSDDYFHCSIFCSGLP